VFTPEGPHEGVRAALPIAPRAEHPAVSAGAFDIERYLAVALTFGAERERLSRVGRQPLSDVEPTTTDLPDLVEGHTLYVEPGSLGRQALCGRRPVWNAVRTERCSVRL